MIELSEIELQEINSELLRRLDLRRTDVNRMSNDELWQVAERHLREILDRGGARAGRAELERRLLQEVVGLGVLEDLLSDESVTEIMVNGPETIFVERCGRLARTALRFSGSRALQGVIERLLQQTGRRVDESSPMADARLLDGSRVNVVVPPLSTRGAIVTIRKFGRRRPDLEALIDNGTLSRQMADFLLVAVRARRNIVVSGGTGTGKTTLLNCLSELIPPEERIVTIEDSAELRLRHENLVSLEARPTNVEGRGLVTIRDLVRNALRMRPDRIVVGECRGGETLDMLQAMNTGHDGSLTTAHANTPRDLLSRLEVMTLMAGMDLPLVAVREQIASAVNLIVQQTRFPCGSRRIVSIAEVTGTEAGRIQMQDLFRFERTSQGVHGPVQGTFRPCGNEPVFFESLVATQRPAPLCGPLPC
ncbi:MAG: CpaF family protein [Steroidobacteraceae bacterium]